MVKKQALLEVDANQLAEMTKKGKNFYSSIFRKVIRAPNLPLLANVTHSSHAVFCYKTMGPGIHLDVTVICSIYLNIPT